MTYIYIINFFSFIFLKRAFFKIIFLLLFQSLIVKMFLFNDSNLKKNQYQYFFLFFFLTVYELKILRLTV